MMRFESPWRTVPLVVVLLLGFEGLAPGQPWPGGGPVVRVVPTATAVPSPPMLGTFYPDADHYLYFGGGPNMRTGYYPLGMYGPTSLSLIGPLSNLRPVAAPVLTYTRGYDGLVRPSVGTSVSYPNQPSLSPVIYPTRANVYPGFPVITGNPGWQSAIYWIDQN